MSFGWNSLEATAALAKSFTYLGFATLFLLGVFEVLGHVYEVREAELKEQANAKKADDLRAESDARILEAQRGLAEAKERTAILENSAQQLRTEAEIARKQAEADRLARKKLELSVTEIRTPRFVVLSDDFRNTLKLYAGTPFSVGVHEDAESVFVAFEIIQGLTSCGWNYRAPAPTVATSDVVKLPFAIENAVVYAYKSLISGVSVDAGEGQRHALEVVTEWLRLSNFPVAGSGPMPARDGLPPSEQRPMRINIGQRSTNHIDFSFQR